MKPLNKSISLLQRKPRIATRQQVMVAMKLQSLLPLCIEAVKACCSTGLVPSEKINIHSSVSSKIKLWLDATLFQSALIDLLEESVKRFDKKNDIVVSVSSTGMHSSRLYISYVHKNPDHESNDDQCTMTYHSNDRTREIVTQHQCAMTLRKDGQKITIEVMFP
jgi:hypothetical protein